MKTTNKMSLRVWSSLSDDFDHEQLADNWAKIDAHDHSSGRGVQIATGGIYNEAITAEKLAPAVVARLLAESEAYGAESTLAAATPVTPTKRVLVQGTVKLKTSSSSPKVEVKVGTEIVAILEASKAEKDQQFPIHFFVPAGVAWEWKEAAATVTSFKYRTIEL